jgi:hypothetical protein
MDVTLGPWKADKSVNESQGKPLAEAMGDEAWKTVTNLPDFTPLKAPGGKPADKGFTISGVLASVAKKGVSTEVVAKFTLWVDGTFSNVAPLDGRASAEGSSSAEDALRAVTEDRVTMLLMAIKAGHVAKLH